MFEKLRRIPVDEFTSPCPFTVSRDTKMELVKNMMDEHGIRHMPVVDHQEAIGIISDRDLKVLGKFPAWSSFVAEDVMSPNPYTVTPTTNLDEVALQMSERKIGSAIVQDETGEIVGIFTSTDALNALVEVIRGEV
jgi:acetoin utilization protein AcuB